jgi:DNA polymerase I-like protein with 3'-5' exonuclease and polymerase domains
MLLLENGSMLVEKISELPNVAGSKELFLDVETNWNDGPHKHKGDDKKKIEDSMPFHGDRICGIAVTVDDDPRSWYIPIRHRDEKWNLPLSNVQIWLKDTVGSCKDWINHNINFDAHFVKREGIDFGGRLVDTLTLSKLIDSDRFSHSLKPICKEWCGLDMLEEGKIKAHLKGRKSCDYSSVPADILGAYATEDVTSNRTLYRFLQSKKTADLSGVWETEIKFTPVLYDIEEFGMPVNPQELQIELAKSIYKSITMETELARLIGGEINPNSNPQLYDLLINRFGLPVLGFTDTGGPSFDKDIMILYKVHPTVLMDENLKHIIDLLTEVITETHFRGLYLESFSRLHVNGILHPTYNQCIRTGRLSCKMPNAQQLNSRAKTLIHPLPGYGINSRDYSQIEFRLIVHYIKDDAAIEEYRKNPRTDFHQWVADMGHIKRKIAKNVNFAIAFGAGKNKTVLQLKGTQEIIDEMMAKAAEWEADPRKFPDIKFTDKKSVFQHFCAERAETVYNEYHQRLPGIKSTSRKASDTIAKRGFVYNAYGRRRHIPAKLKFKAFNAIIQSCASDVMKDCMTKISPRYNSWIRDLNVNFFALVHDESADQSPLEVCQDPTIQEKITKMFEETSIPFRVPMVMEHHFSDKNWAEAGK